MASTSITFTFPNDAFGKREHGQPLRKFRQIRRDTGATFVIDLKTVDSEGKLTVIWNGSDSECREARKMLVAAVRKFNTWQRNQPKKTEGATVEQIGKVPRATTLQHVANVDPALQNAWKKVRKTPPSLQGFSAKRSRSPTPEMTKENFPALPAPAPAPMVVPIMTAAPPNAFGSNLDPYAGIPDDMTDEDYKNMENYLDDFTAQGWRDEDCVQGEIMEQLLESEIAGTECDPAPNSPFKVACYYPEESMYDEKGNLISLYHNYSRRVSWSPELVRKPMVGAY